MLGAGDLPQLSDGTDPAEPGLDIPVVEQFAASAAATPRSISWMRPIARALLSRASSREDELRESVGGSPSPRFCEDAHVDLDKARFAGSTPPFGALMRAAADGATTTSNAVRRDVCFRAEAKLASTADIGAKRPFATHKI